MIFIETPVFTEDLHEHLSDEEYQQFQQYLAANPEVGDVIVGTGGLRKVRWTCGGKGKRGGVRVIYYYLCLASQIRLLLIYRKGAKDNLTELEKGLLRKLNQGWQ
jgi:mRNA-degrading endonuclease RelE of RelBE toxin-antitoxin system